jgi:microsomal dipeptidase-like Zn-dependent dipeptidase
MRKLIHCFVFLMIIQVSVPAQIPRPIRKEIKPLDSAKVLTPAATTPVAQPIQSIQADRTIRQTQPAQQAQPAQPVLTVIPAMNVATAAPLKDPLRGFADLHCHQMANLAYGGQAFHGRAFGPIDQSMNSCAAYHSGIIPDFAGWIVQNVAYSINKSHGLDGYPTFTTWPSWYSLTHQGVYEESLYRAFQGGLRLMVMLAVNNEHLAGSVNKSWSGDDETAIIKQIDEAYAMQTYIDSKSGGAGKGWYRIVKTPQEARNAIINNQLAVVLGIEVDYPLGSKDERNGAGYTLNGMIDKLNFYYAKGIRHIFPVHFDNNFLGGASFDKSLDDDMQTFDVTDGTIRVYKMNTYDGRNLGYAYYGGKANVRGLLSTGQRMVREMMKRGMIIDMDHMSRNSKNDLLSIAESVSYPAIVSSHSGFVDICAGDKRHEGNLRADEVNRVYNLGGMVAPILWQGTYDQLLQYSTKVQVTRGGSTEAWASAYLYAKDKMPGRPIGVGSDFNGGIPATGPRFGADAAPYGKSTAYINQMMQVTYPFLDQFSGQSMVNMSKLGVHQYNINTDGFAHYGMFPDFLSDLTNVGLTPQDLEPLFNSAKYYIDMWEKGVNKGNSTNWTVLNGNRIDEGTISDTDGDMIEYTVDANAAPAGTIIISLCIPQDITWEKRLRLVIDSRTPVFPGLLIWVKDNTKCSNMLLDGQIIALHQNGSFIFSKEKGIFQGGVQDVKVIPYNFFRSLPPGCKVSLVWAKG